MRKNLLILMLLALMGLAGPAVAQVIPDPSANHELYIRNKAGRIVQRLSPQGDHYNVYDAKRQFVPQGYARLLGRRLIIYDLNNKIMATARAEMLPPNSDLSNITVVRDRDGHPIGMLERH